MADPAPPPQIDGKVLRTMLNLIVNAVQVHHLSLEEACGRAWGYGHAYHAWLPAEAIDEGIRHCCEQLRLSPPGHLATAADHGIPGQPAALHAAAGTVRYSGGTASTSQTPLALR